MYQNPKAFYEVVATIYSGYYNDERVLLRDLLFPENSPIYKMEKFKSLRSDIGIFKKEFLNVFNKGTYPNLNKAFAVSASTNYRTSGPAPIDDTTQEIFSNSNGVSIYFPYSENFAAPLTKEYFDQINTYPGYKATIVAADRVADSGPGDEPYPCGTIQDKHYCFRAVIVNDDYAEGTATHIVGVGVTVTPSRIDTIPPSTNVNRVFVGWGRINNKRQYDKLISFNSANGGGSEIKICRISGYLQFQDQQVTNFTGDQAEMSFKRRDIRRGIWKRIYNVWDADWVAGNTEQVMAVYEEDNEGTETFNASLNTTLLRRDSTTINGSIGYSITVKTQDELVLQSKFSRVAYFTSAKSDQGCGFEMCDTKGGACRYDDTFLPSGQHWPIYNCGANWNFTWPYNSY